MMWLDVLQERGVNVQLSNALTPITIHHYLKLPVSHLCLCVVYTLFSGFYSGKANESVNAHDLTLVRPIFRDHSVLGGGTVRRSVTLRHSTLQQPIGAKANDIRYVVSPCGIQAYVAGQCHGPCVGKDGSVRALS